MSKVKVQKSDPPETKAVLAEAIVKIGSALRELTQVGLNEDAIVVLLHHKTKVPMKQIRIIFDGLRQLEGWYCR